MDPVIALVGRPNVGKSTLFNYLTRTRDALVADYPGLTRDRKYGLGKVGPAGYVVVDTGGLGDDPEGVEQGMQAQARKAVGEADAVIFLVDARAGVTAGDMELAGELRRLGKPIYLAVNKVDGLDPAVVSAEFHTLGMGETHPIAAAHGRGVTRLLEAVLADTDTGPAHAAEEEQALVGDQYHGICVAVIGRPNVGKSTMVNRILGEERVLVYDMPGTTRDSIYVPFEKDGHAYTLVDTAGVRRRARVKEAVEKFSVIKTLQAIEAAHVVIMVVDAREGITEQDAGLVGHALDAGRALVVAVNKWDGLDSGQRDEVKRLLNVKLGFLEFAKVHFVSALHGSGVGLLLDSVREAYDAANRDLATNRLTQILEDAVDSHPPPLVRGRRIKLRYAHQGGRNPPVIVIHGNQVDRVPQDYRRYLMNTFRKVLDLYGTPVRIEFKGGANPYEGRRNTLTPRQLSKRRRMMKHVKTKK